MANVPVLHRHGLTQPHPVASTTNPRVPFRYGGTSGLLLMPLGSVNQEPCGMNGEGTAALGDTGVVYERQNVVKAIAGASLGANARVGIGSTNGILIPAIASGSWEVGLSQTPAAAGEVFALYIDPRKA